MMSSLTLDSGMTFSMLRDDLEEFILKDISPSEAPLIDALKLRAALRNILDETNINRAKRKPWIELFPNETIISLLFISDNPLERRMKDPRGYPREKWDQVINSMKESLEPPQLSEGFSSCIVIS